MSDSQGVRVGGATHLGPRPDQRGGGPLGVVHLERDAETRCHPSADLHVVDHRDLGRVRQLEGRAARVEDQHVLAAVAGEVELDRQAERVAVEGDRGVEVLGLDDEPELADAGEPATVLAEVVPGASQW